MSLVRMLADCIARPDDGGRRFGLVEHLEAVAAACGDLRGPAEEKMAFLAGLMHDAAKAAWDWQIYIRPGGPKKGPEHSPLGAALFAYFAEDLVPRWANGDKNRLAHLKDLALDWARMIYGHHGGLKDLDRTAPWTASFAPQALTSLLATCSQSELVALVRKHIPECGADLTDFATWLPAFDDKWRRRFESERGKLLKDLQQSRDDDVPLAPEALRLARLGARLIFADRSHAADWDVEHLSVVDAGRGAAALDTFCKTRAAEALNGGADANLVRARTDLQETALGRYRANAERTTFSLVLPTGYGKTLTGLRVALEACRSGRCRRILYVAPYISILSQAAAEIQKATGLEVFVHHHLTAAMQEDHEPYDLLETWQTPILATTFNQFFRSLFPARAQQCLRIPALEDAFILIDEPQIVDPATWNVFLRALAVQSAEYRCQALLMTATLPPPRDGLGVEPIALAAPEQTAALPTDRYSIRTRVEPWTARRTAEEAVRRLKKFGSVAVILNTVRDAVEVFRLASQAKPASWRCLTALMLPGHKSAVIAEIAHRLDLKNPAGQKPTGVVCTQILEAGVDLSFRTLLRATSILSSVAQAAGRANRHGGGSTPAEVIVFPFLREDGKDSRNYVYKDETAVRHTDALLAEHPQSSEASIREILDEYYRRCWKENRRTTSLERFEQAARGAWSALAGLEPFGGEPPRTNVFVPYADRCLCGPLSAAMARFAPEGSRQLLERFCDPAWRKTLSFRDRKRLNALVSQCSVPLPQKVADIFAEPTAAEWLWELKRPADYRDDVGLAHLLLESPSRGDDEAESLII